MKPMSTVLTVTDLTAASYQLVGLAASIAGEADGEVILVSTYGGGGSRRRSAPPSRPPVSPDGWREEIESRLRQEAQLLERQRQWCADRGVRCRAELYEDGSWPDFVLQSARGAHVDLILVGMQLVGSAYEVGAEEVRRLAEAAPCQLSMVRLPSHLAV